MICEFKLPDASLRCFVVRQLLSCIYALSSVKFSGLKLWLCKKSDKYEVCICIFSVTRRYRSDECDSLTDSVIVRIDLTDVTLVSDDTYRRLY